MALGSRRSLFRCYTNAEWKERTFWVTVNTTISVQHPSALVLSPYSLPPLLLFSFFLFLIIDSNSSDTYLFIEFTVFISRLRISYVFIHKMWLIRECLKSPSAPSPSQHQGFFQWVSSSYQVAKVLEFQLQHQSFRWIFRVDFL